MISRKPFTTLVPSFCSLAYRESPRLKRAYCRLVNSLEIDFVRFDLFPPRPSASTPPTTTPSPSGTLALRWPPSTSRPGTSRCSSTPPASWRTAAAGTSSGRSSPSPRGSSRRTRRPWPRWRSQSTCQSGGYAIMKEENFVCMVCFYFLIHRPFVRNISQECFLLSHLYKSSFLWSICDLCL